MNRYTEISFTDELLADGSVHRRFSDGRQEWRWRGPGQIVHWRDTDGVDGTDEPLGRHLVKRRSAAGQVTYGREQGYGRTAWGNGTMTINRTSFGGRVGALIAAAGAGVLLGAVVAPPLALSFAEEEELRRQAQAQSGSGGDGGGGGDDWDDDSGGGDDDFG